MRRVIAEASKIIDRADQSATEDVVPESIRDDAGGERIVGRGDLLGELQAAAASGHESFGVESLKVATRDDGRRLLVFSAHEEWHIEALCFKEPRSATRDGEFGFQFAVFGSEGGELGRGGRRGVEHSVSHCGIEQRRLGFGGLVASPGLRGFG